MCDSLRVKLSRTRESKHPSDADGMPGRILLVDCSEYLAAGMVAESPDDLYKASIIFTAYYYY